MAEHDFDTYVYTGSPTVTIGSSLDCEPRFHGETEKETKDMGDEGLKVFNYGSLHWEAGEWVIGDTRVNDMISRLIGGYQNRIGGDLFITFKMRPVNTDSADPGFGGPFEPSEPVSAAKK